MSYINKGVPGIGQYLTLNEPDVGAVLPKELYPQNAEIPLLFKPLTIRGVTFNNRIFVSPMCQFSSDNGHATDWHLVHIGGFATRGVGGVCMEATAVLPEGRISPQDAGLWADSHIAPLKRVVTFVQAHGVKIGIQLSHAGRKASTGAPWLRFNSDRTAKTAKYIADSDEGGWLDEVFAPSEVPFSAEYPQPKAISEEQLQAVVDAFGKAAERCKAAGYQYGGSLENRLRFPLQVIERVRAVWDKPLFVRISATEWAEGPEQDPSTGEWKQWGIEQSKIYVGELKKLGVDLIDCSSGGNWVKQKITSVPGYQVPFAEALKKTYPGLPIGAVGMITEPEQAESYLREGKADIVSLARGFIRQPHWALLAAEKLGVAVKAANQYERGFPHLIGARHP